MEGAVGADLRVETLFLIKAELVLWCVGSPLHLKSSREEEEEERQQERTMKEMMRPQ